MWHTNVEHGFYTDRAIRQFWKQLTSITAVKITHVEQCSTRWLFTGVITANRCQNCPIACSM